MYPSTGDARNFQEGSCPKQPLFLVNWRIPCLHFAMLHVFCNSWPGQISGWNWICLGIFDISIDDCVSSSLWDKNELWSSCQCAGFTNRSESEYDPFGAGHSSTSVSAALGMAVGRDFKVGLLFAFQSGPSQSRTHRLADLNGALPTVHCGTL